MTLQYIATCSGYFFDSPTLTKQIHLFKYPYFRTGVLSDDRMKLDYVLGLKIEDFLERRLQTQVIYKLWQPSYKAVKLLSKFC